MVVHYCQAGPMPDQNFGGQKFLSGEATIGTEFSERKCRAIFS